jgi:flagellar M-ring protein FliF
MLDNRNAASAGGANAFEKQDRTVNYEIGKITSRIVEPTGKLTRVSLAVLVDGTYKQVPKKGGGTERQYISRTPDEIQKIESIVKRAVNFDAERGDKVEVVNIPFEVTEWAKADEVQAAPGWLSILGQVAPYLKPAFMGLFLLLSFLFFVKPLVRWLTEYSLSDVEIVKQLPKTVGEIEREMAGMKSLPYLNQASQLVASDGEASVGAMRSWLKE